MNQLIFLVTSIMGTTLALGHNLNGFMDEEE